MISIIPMFTPKMKLSSESHVPVMYAVGPPRQDCGWGCTTTHAQPQFRSGLPPERSEMMGSLTDTNECFLYSTMYCKKQKKGKEGCRRQILVWIREKQNSHTVGGSVKYKIEWGLTTLGKVWHFLK